MATRAGRSTPRAHPATGRGRCRCRPGRDRLAPRRSGTSEVRREVPRRAGCLTSLLPRARSLRDAAIRTGPPHRPGGGAARLPRTTWTARAAPWSPWRSSSRIENGRKAGSASRRRASARKSEASPPRASAIWRASIVRSERKPSRRSGVGSTIRRRPSMRVTRWTTSRCSLRTRRRGDVLTGRTPGTGSASLPAGATGLDPRAGPALDLAGAAAISKARALRRSRCGCGCPGGRAAARAAARPAREESRA